MRGTSQAVPDPRSARLWVLDQPKSEMVCPRRRFALTARGDHVARAVSSGAQVRAAAVHALNPAGPARVVRSIGDAWIRRDARAFEIRVVVVPVPVAGPLPDIAGDIVERVAVRRVRGDLRRAGV